MTIRSVTMAVSSVLAHLHTVGPVQAQIQCAYTVE